MTLGQYIKIKRMMKLFKFKIKLIKLLFDLSLIILIKNYRELFNFNKLMLCIEKSFNTFKNHLDDMKYNII